MVTEPGMDGFLSDNGRPIEDIERKVKISIDKNNAVLVFAVGHFDCKGNPVNEATIRKTYGKQLEGLRARFRQFKLLDYG